jgi:glycerophosphoryl diester phosphodiesterase
MHETDCCDYIIAGYACPHAAAGGLGPMPRQTLAREWPPARHSLAALSGRLDLANQATDVELHGHRGARGLAPENTLLSIHAAMRFAVDFIEIDVGMSRDHEIVIHHDHALNPDIVRLGGKWIPQPLLLKTLTAAELAAYDVGRLKPGTQYAGDYPGQTPVDGERIPLLRQLLEMPELVSREAIRLNIEIKTSPFLPDETFAPSEICKVLSSLIVQHGFQDRVRVQSFDWRNLLELRRIAPAIPLGFLTSRRSARDNAGAGGARPPNSEWFGGIDLNDFGGSLPLAISRLGGRVWGPDYRDLRPLDVEAAHAHGLKVVVWTVNGPESMREMLAMGVDGITTDYPDIGRRVIDDWLAATR